MTLEAFDFVDEVTSFLFGRERWDCHFPLLVAAFTADVDVLLPTLYFACSNYSTIDEVIDQANSMTPECLLTLIKGREKSDIEANKLISGLPDDLLEEVRTSACTRMEPCLRNALYTRLFKLINHRFSAIQGSRVVAYHLSPVCASCSSFVTKAIEKKREEIWANIPFHFGFPAWDVLQEGLEQITEPKVEVSCFAITYDCHLIF